MIVRTISIRSISDMPSKIVKIVDYGQLPQVSGLHDPVVSARIQHRLSEGNDGFRSARVRIQAWFGRTPRRQLLAMKLFAARAEIGTDDIILLRREFSGR